MAPVLDEAWVGTDGGVADQPHPGLRYRFFSYVPARDHADGRAGPPGRRRGAGLRRAEAARAGHPRAPAPADLADPGAATGFGVGGGARPLRAGVQPARALRPRRAGPRGVEPQRTLAAAAGRVLGARGGADGRRRLAAAALADAGVRPRPVGHRDRQEESAGWPTTSSPRSTELGPATAGQIEAHLGAEPRGKKGPWWDRSDTKWVAEALFVGGGADDGDAGRLRPSLRPDRDGCCRPRCWRARSTTRRRSANSRCGRPPRSASATEADIRDYFRLSPKQVKPAIAKLVAEGELEPVEVDGWTAPAYLRAGQIVPAARSRDGAAVPVRPADLLPAASRAAIRLPLPHRDLHARAETPIRLLRLAVSARRAAGRPRRPEGRTHATTRCTSSARSPNPAQTPSRVAPALAAELRSMASWLGLAEVTVGERGDLTKRRCALVGLTPSPGDCGLFS